MLLQQHLGSQRWTEVGVSGADQFDGILPNASVDLAVRRAATRLMRQSTAALLLVPCQQSKGLSHTQRQHRRRRDHRATFSQNFCQYLYPLEIPLTHLYQSHPVSVTSNGRDYDISNERLHCLLLQSVSVGSHAKL